MLGVGEPIKLEDTPKQQKRKRGERLRTKFNIRGQRKKKKKIRTFRNKGQAIVCCRITRREFS